MAVAEEQILKPYHQTDRFSLFVGDCREVMKSMADNSVDAVVTDPPYELTANKRGGTGAASLNLNSPAGRSRVTTGFMGQRWDGTGAPFEVDTWIECLRVLKPGGHLLAFGGSRTYHRLACAIEDAGFDIRDQIQYLYGSGFPKSLNVSKNLREEGSVCTCNDKGISDRSETEGTNEVRQHTLRCLPDADLSPSIYPEDQSREILQPGLSEQSASQYRATRSESETTGSQQPGVERRRDRVQEEGQLHGSAIRESARVGVADGPQGWLYHGASVDHGSDVRLSSHQNGSSQPQESQTVDQRSAQLGAVPDECRSQAWGGWPHCGRCSKPMVPEGIGSALKPAHEPIVVARKPLTSTLIANVYAFGTGGLNIDRCRIEMDEQWVGRDLPDAKDGVTWGGQLNSSSSSSHPMGRWPANVIHDGSEEVVALFPQEAGAAAPVYKRNGDKFRNAYGAFAGNSDEAGSTFQGDSGSAARFFYCAKATQEDRNEGLDCLPLLPAGALKSGDGGWRNEEARGRQPRHDAQYMARNYHPTVKPTDLMRYLCRLITPPGGIVLDPFCGSGSTGKAAMLEGFKFVSELIAV